MTIRAVDLSQLTVREMRHALDVEKDMPFAAPEVQREEFKRRIAEGLPTYEVSPALPAPSPADSLRSLLIRARPYVTHSELNAEIGAALERRPSPEVGPAPASPSSLPQPPRRAVEVVIKLGADSHETALRALTNYVRMAEREYDNKAFRTVSGGYDSGYSVELSEHPEMHHDRYVADLNAYLTATRVTGPEKS